ncbi:hypothetical protein OG864_35020 [Streptomyces sp. NBC_00124]|uniref:hypothetical protein n=1 Tax=Streptomyces sp. NBC_00124 TaxID=2975662 RepID=UPI00225A192A|nr:hypothetical protein [Streptomyces sp. NBC_00124]MCX5363896.1 hypothetical protein [Streptomyces sp. NBC_00124]
MSKSKKVSLTGLWQWILWADGYLPNVSSIDCVFGSGTQEATRKWNVDRSWDTLHSGRAETQSFANADNGLRFGGDYNSTLQSHGAYYFRNPDTGGWISAAYNTGSKANACG